jgi:hypothetical protein
MAPPTSALRDYGFARQAQRAVGGLRLVAYASESAPTLPIFSFFLLNPLNPAILSKNLFGFMK